MATAELVARFKREAAEIIDEYGIDGLEEALAQADIYPIFKMDHIWVFEGWPTEQGCVRIEVEIESIP